MNEDYNTNLNMNIPSKRFLFLIIAVLVLTASLFLFISSVRQMITSVKAPERPSILSACPTEPPEEFGIKPDIEKANISSSLLDKSTKDLIKNLRDYEKIKNAAKEKAVKDTAKSRKKHLVETMRINPDSALSSILTSKEREALNDITTNCVEKEETLEGTLEIIITDFFEDSTSKTQYTLITESERVIIHPTRGLKDYLESRTKIRVKGFRIDDDFVFDGLSSLSEPSIEGSGIDVLSQPGNPPVLGVQQTIVILADFQNTSPPSLTADQVNDVVFNQVNDFYIENSYNQISLAGNVIDNWYELPINQTCNFWDIRNAAIAAADPDVFFPDYSRLVIIVQPGFCQWNGVSTIGKNSISTDDGIVAMSVASIDSDYNNFHYVGHELGHGFGNYHAKFLKCGDASICLIEAECSGSVTINCYVEYGDRYNIMGSLGSGRHFNAPHKEHVGWLSSSSPYNIETVTADGRYVIEPIETATTGLKALKIQRDAFSYLYIEYRQPIGYDANFLTHIFGTDVYEGALLHIIPATTSSPYLIDTTPPADSKTSALKPGMTFTDPLTGTTVEVISATASELTVDIVIGPIDLIGPEVSIALPLEGETLSGIVTVSADASDRSGVERVEFSLNGDLFATDTTEPYSVSLDTTHAPNGDNEIQVKAYDTLGNLSPTYTVEVIIANTDPESPTVTLTLPLNGSVVTDPVVVSADASDNVGIWKVEFEMDAEGVPSGPPLFESPYEVSLNFGPGPHTLLAKAYDFVGNSTDSSIVCFTVVLDEFDDTSLCDNNPPTLKILKPDVPYWNQTTEEFEPPDGQVDLFKDIFSVSLFMDTRCGDANFQPAYDLDGSCDMSMFGDLFTVAEAFGLNWPPDNLEEERRLHFWIKGEDPDPGDTITYSMTGLPANATLDATTGEFEWTPDSSQGRTTPYTVTFTVDDGTDTDSESLSITVLDNQ